MSFCFWVLARYTKAWRRFFDVSILLTIGGVAVGVAVLVVAMSAFSGFESTLKQAIIEVVGHVSVYKRGGRIEDAGTLKKKINKYSKDVVDEMEFLQQESLISSKGKISAVSLNGVEKEKMESLLNIKKRISSGKLSWADKDGVPAAFLGKELAKKLSLDIGDVFTVIFPRASKVSVSDLNPIVKKFYLVATVDLGKYDFNSRFLFIDLPVAQEILSTKAITGVRYKLRSADIAEEWARNVQEDIGWTYAAVDWRQQNKNYLSAIEYEKYVMFFVILIILITACVNVTTSLFVLVLKKYRDISLFRTLGASPSMIVMLFCVHGLFIGVVGLVCGWILGISMCWGFEGLQLLFPIMPSDIYKISFVSTEFRLSDVVLISVATLIICLLSTFIPAIRGATLSPIEGLKYE
jgi:lipoprotein-releasing system permease protein